MRISEQYFSANYLSNINATRERMAKLQTEIASNKRVQKVSDDPQASDSILRLKAALARNDQFASNIVDARGMAETTESTLDQFGGLLQDLQEVLVQARNGARSDSLSTYAEQVDRILDDALQLANTKMNGKFVFGGVQTTTPPFTLAADRSAVTTNPAGITGTISYALAEGLTKSVNIDGAEAFQGTAFFDTMIALRDKMKGGIFPDADDAAAVDAAIDHVTSKTAQVGSLINNLESMGAYIDERNVQLMSMLSEQQDADIAQSITKLKQEEVSLNAALQTGATILPKSLVDFIR